MDMVDSECILCSLDRVAVVAVSNESWEQVEERKEERVASLRYFDRVSLSW
jgi:hypothetical protein